MLESRLWKTLVYKTLMLSLKCLCTRSCVQFMFLPIFITKCVKDWYIGLTAIQKYPYVNFRRSIMKKTFGGAMYFSNPPKNIGPPVMVRNMFEASSHPALHFAAKVFDMQNANHPKQLLHIFLIFIAFQWSLFPDNILKVWFQQFFDLLESGRHRFLQKTKYDFHTKKHIEKLPFSF